MATINQVFDLAFLRAMLMILPGVFTLRMHEHILPGNTVSFFTAKKPENFPGQGAVPPRQRISTPRRQENAALVQPGAVMDIFLMQFYRAIRHGQLLLNDGHGGNIAPLLRASITRYQDDRANGELINMWQSRGPGPRADAGARLDVVPSTGRQNHGASPSDQDRRQKRGTIERSWRRLIPRTVRFHAVWRCSQQSIGAAAT